MANQPSKENLAALEKSIHSSLQKFASAPAASMSNAMVKSLVSAGAHIRDNVAFQLPLINVAIYAFQDLASTREWTVSGKPTAVANTVDLINGYRTWDYTTGMVKTGFEHALRQRSVDHNLVGRTAFRVDRTKKQIEYLDPTRLHYKIPNREKVNGMVPPVEDNDVVWAYGGARSDPWIKWGEVHLNHAMPVGVSGFIAPFMLAYPQALMAWLLEQHDESVVNGRKLRDIIITGKGLKLPIMQALEQALAMWTEADPTKQSIPLVEVAQNYSGSGALQDQIAFLGLSKLPENFDRAAFRHYYANVISGAFGLALRQFWQEDSNTNRALEEVQEARQQLKGPLAFVRAEQRLINASDIVRMFAPASRPCDFRFVEESDTSSLKDRAEAISYFAKSLKDLSEAAGARLKPEIIIRQAQEFNLLPGDMPIEEMLLSAEEVAALLEQEQPDVVDDGNISSSPDARTNTADEVSIVKSMLIRLEQKRQEYSKARELDRDEITMTGKGIIIDRRPFLMQKADIHFKELDHNVILRYADENEDGNNLDGFGDTVFVEAMLDA